MVLYYVIPLIISNILDLVYFYKITKLKIRDKCDYFFILLVIIFVIYINNIMNSVLASFQSSIFLILILLFKFSDIVNWKIVVGSLLIVFNLDLLNDILYTIFINILKNNVVNINGLVIFLLNLALIFVELVVVFKCKDTFYNFLNSKNSNIFLSLLIYLYFIGMLIGFIYSKSTRVPPVSKFLLVTLIVQAIFAIGMYYELLRIQKTILKRRQQEELQKDLEQQKNYTETLEKDEDNLRRFRHDYKNMLTAIKYSIQNGDYEKAVAELDKYTEENLDNDALLKYKDVNHVKIDYVKSLLVAKISKMANEDINYDFECREDIDKLPTGINELDLIRIMGIVIDNAIEESQKIISETKDNSQAKIQMMMYSSEDTGFEFEIRNKIKDSNINPVQMKKAGYSTKENHAGLGLANIDQIGQKYPAMDISYEIIDGYFDFYLVVEGDE